jgi:UDP-N-acetylmuramoylalanine--D-glutamate ligase
VNGVLPLREGDHDRTHGGFVGVRAVVVGMAASGLAAARALLNEGADVRITESSPLDRIESGAPAGADLLAGGHRPEHLDGATLVVVSPGVPEGADVIRWARERKLPVWSELELGYRLCRVPFVAVTGTNGKTTTVELLAAMMRSAGLRARACGNVGHPFSTAAGEPFDALAVEASSFQLRFAPSFHPTVSVLLNLAPDHLDWHGSYERYATAKARIFANQTGEDVHVSNLDDADAAARSRTARCRVLWFREGSPGPGEVGVENGAVLRRAGGGDGEDLMLGEPPFDAPRFLADAAGACAAGLAFGLAPAAIADAVAMFELLPHRGEPVGRIGGVTFLDDSKATNPHAALASLRGFEHAILIAGGRGKGIDLSPLASAAPNLDGVVAIGEAADDVVAVFSGLVPAVSAASIEDAVRRALRMAAPGRTVVLAPACASWDMFRDYKERGERFAAAVAALAAEEDGRAN